MQRSVAAFLFFAFFLMREANARLNSVDSARLQQAITEFSAGHYAESHSILLRLAEKNSEDPLVLFNLGNAQFMLADYSSALSSYKSVIRLRSPLAPAARLYLAKSLGRLGRKSEARSLLQSLNKNSTPRGLRAAVIAELSSLRQKPNFGDDDIAATALLHYRNDRYSESLTVLDRLKAPTSEDARLFRALVLLRLNRISEARPLLRDLSRYAVQTEIRRSARDLLSTLDESATVSSGPSMFLDMSAGTTNNPYLYPSSYAAAVSKGMAELAIGGSYQISMANGFALRPSYALTLQETVKEKQLRNWEQNVQVPFYFESRSTLTKLMPFYNHQIWAETPSLERFGLFAHFEWQPRRFTLGAEGEFAMQKPLETSLSYLNGETMFARLFAGYSLFPVYCQIAYEVTADNSGDLTYADGSVLPLTNTSQGVRLRIIWRMTKTWVLAGDFGHIDKTYDRLAMPGGKVRRDRQLSAGIRVKRRMTPLLSIFSDIQYRKNSSTLGPADVTDKNYSVLSGLTGVSWDLL